MFPNVFGRGHDAVPRGMEVEKAVLQLYAVQYVNRPRRLAVRGVTVEWMPNEVTWVNPGGRRTWDVPGLGSGRDVTACCDLVTVVKPGWVDFNVTALARRWSASGKNFGVLIEGDGVTFHSADADTVAKRPRLVVAYRTKKPAPRRTVLRGLTRPRSDREVLRKHVPVSLTQVAVRTAGCVDLSSLEAMNKGIVGKAAKPHDRVMSLFHFMRRRLYRDLTPTRRGQPLVDVLDVLDGYGWASGEAYARMWAQVLSQEEIPCRMVRLPREPTGEHYVAEAYFDAAWRALDPSTGFCVFRRGSGAVAGLEEIRKDPALLTDAVKEKRVPPGFLNTAGELGSVAWWAKAVQHMKVGKEEIEVAEPPGVVPPTLHLGTKITYSWAPILWQAAYDAPEQGPHDPNGALVEKDRLHFPHYKPYLNDDLSARLETDKVYRCWANGVLEFRPDLGSRALTRVLESRFDPLRFFSDDGRTPLLHSRAGGARAEFRVRPPGVIVDGQLTTVFARTGSRNTFGVSVLGGSDKKRLYSLPLWNGPEIGVIRMTERDLRPFVYGEHYLGLDYDWKCEETADTGVHDLQLKLLFQINREMLPALDVGENDVTVTFKEPDPTFGKDRSRLVVTYCWLEDGRDEKTHEQFVTRSPTTYKITLGGAARPKMKWLSLTLQPSWEQPPER